MMNPMLELKLDLAAVQTKQELMEWLQDSLDFPDYFGGNWDAAEECLHESITEDVRIDIMNEGEVSEEVEKELRRFERIVDDFNASGELQIALSRVEE